MKYPDATLYPPVQSNLHLYKRLLRNIPLTSGQDFQSFLDATSDDTSRNDNDPLNSTQTSTGRGKSFWRKLSFTRKSYRVNPEQNNLPNLANGIAMSDLSDPFDTAHNEPLNEIRTVP